MWNCSVSVDGRAKVSMGADTLDFAIARGISDAVYYQMIYPASMVAITGLHESCTGCGNDGWIRRGLKRAKCTECRGKFPTGTFPDIPFRMPESHGFEREILQYVITKSKPGIAQAENLKLFMDMVTLLRRFVAGDGTGGAVDTANRILAEIDHPGKNSEKKLDSVTPPG